MSSPPDAFPRATSTAPDEPVTKLPSELHIPAVALVGLLAAYLFGGFWTTLSATDSGAHESSDFFWLGRFRMFTSLRPDHGALEAERKTDAGWERVSLAAVYRDDWPEGPGYARNTFRRDPALREDLAASLCQRVDGTAVSLLEVRWPKSLGTYEQPRTDVETRVLGEYICRTAP